MKYFLILLLFVAGCGSGDVLVTKEHVSFESMQTHCPEKTCYAYYYLDEMSRPPSCKIFVLHKDLYLSDDNYHRRLGHETRHCFDGEFH